MESEDVIRVAGLDKYGVKQEDLEIILDELPAYALIDNKGQMAESRDYPFTEDGILDEDEKPDQIGREGESRLNIGYDDLQYHLAGMVGKGSFNVPDDQRLDLPEENQEEALGALFGASYAVFRKNVMETGFPADHATFNQDIESQEERQRFLEEGAYEIQGEVMGPWGYDHELMNDVMDVNTALEVYNEVVDQII